MGDGRLSSAPALQREPFKLCSDPTFFFEDAAHRHAYCRLLTALESQASGICLLTGQPGTGKTLLVTKLVAELERTGHSIFRFHWPPMHVDELLAQCAHKQGGAVPQFVRDDAQTFVASLRRSTKAKPPILVIDEAQLLSNSTLRAICDLTMPRRDTKPPSRVLLSAQSGYLECLRDEDAPTAEFEKATITHVTLAPLDASEVGPFIQHRLKVAGCAQTDLFTPGAIRRISEISDGTPGRIMSLCSQALLLVRMDANPNADEGLIEQAAMALGLGVDKSRAAALAATPMPEDNTSRSDDPGCLVVPRPLSADASVSRDVDEIREADDEAPLPTIASQMAHRARRPERTRKWALGASIVVVAIVAAGGAISHKYYPAWAHDTLRAALGAAQALVSSSHTVITPAKNPAERQVAEQSAQGEPGHPTITDLFTLARLEPVSGNSAVLVATVEGDSPVIVSDSGTKPFATGDLDRSSGLSDENSGRGAQTAAAFKSQAKNSGTNLQDAAVRQGISTSAERGGESSDALEFQIAALRDKLKAAVELSMTQQNDFRAERTKLQQRIIALDENSRNRQLALDDSTQLTTKVEGQLATIAQRLAAYESLDQSNQLLTQQVQKLKKEMEKTKALQGDPMPVGESSPSPTRSALEAAKAALEQKLVNLRVELDHVRDTLGESERELMARRNAAANLEARLEDVESALVSVRGRNSTLETEGQINKDEISTLRAALQASTSSTQSQPSQLAVAGSQTRTVEPDRSRFQASLVTTAAPSNKEDLTLDVSGAETATRVEVKPTHSESPPIAELIARGARYLSLADIVSARLFFELAADKGSARAATAVASTHDPVFYQRNRVLGTRADPEKALRWYRRAVKAGDPNAKARLDDLTAWLLRTDAGGDTETRVLLQAE